MRGAREAGPQRFLHPARASTTLGPCNRWRSRSAAAAARTGRRLRLGGGSRVHRPLAYQLLQLPLLPQHRRDLHRGRRGRRVHGLVERPRLPGVAAVRAPGHRVPLRRHPGDPPRPLVPGDEHPSRGTGSRDEAVDRRPRAAGGRDAHLRPARARPAHRAVARRLPRNRSALDDRHPVHFRLGCLPSLLRGGQRRHALQEGERVCDLGSPADRRRARRQEPRDAQPGRSGCCSRRPSSSTPPARSCSPCT